MTGACGGFPTVKTAIVQALIMYGIAFIVSMLVAALIKGLYVLVQRFSDEKRS